MFYVGLYFCSPIKCLIYSSKTLLNYPSIMLSSCLVLKSILSAFSTSLPILGLWWSSGLKRQSTDHRASQHLCLNPPLRLIQMWSIKFVCQKKMIFFWYSFPPQFMNWLARYKWKNLCWGIKNCYSTLLLIVNQHYNMWLSNL